MAVHGLGSSGSPIVISDEEDAAYVEQELSADRWNSLPRRLDLIDQDPNHSTQFTAPSDAAPTNGAGTSRKRKWNQFLVSEQVPSSHTSPSDAQENTHDPQPEGKRARKKRLKRERAMAEAEIREYSPSSLPQLPPSPQHAMFRPPLKALRPAIHY
ncbi:hypothetical protein A0H81_12186 [Grifola frondosa]|uniref:Uncharacterized protein n=1 Tax=Grifola frondosa TaxID=5627 RepID=A0A1C7LTA4_GRIFR|nr:hypothetical protein A0H81_12186 [Grifola frondosa]